MKFTRLNIVIAAGMGLIGALRIGLNLVPSEFSHPIPIVPHLLWGQVVFSLIYGYLCSGWLARKHRSLPIQWLVLYLNAPVFMGLAWALGSVWIAPGQEAEFHELMRGTLVDQFSETVLIPAIFWFLVMHPDGRGYLQGLWERACRQLELRPSTVLAVVLMPYVVCAIFFVLQFLYFPAARFFGREDSVFELMTPICFLGGSLFAIRIAWRLMQSDYKAFAALYVGLAVLALFFAGEELAWGSRIFHYRSTIQAVNTQGDVTLHNLPAFQWHLDQFMYFAALMVVLASFYLLLARPDLVENRLTFLVFPHYVLLSIFIIMLLTYGRYRSIAITFMPQKQYFNECVEGLLGLTFFLYVFFNHRSLRRGGLMGLRGYEGQEA